MNPLDQVEYLIQLQDLDLMIRELGDEKAASVEKKMGFEMGSLDTLRSTREQLAKKIDGELLRRYERMHAKFLRAVVPMRDGICFGCFVRQPAKRAVGDTPDPNVIESCNHCGRILFKFRFP